VYISAAAFVALCSATHFTPKASPKDRPDQISVQVKTLPADEIEKRLQRGDARDPDREKSLKQMFEAAGCAGDRLVEQQVKHQKLPNVICTLPGADDSEIVIGAHFDHVDEGKGIVDNWSGASLLPSFLEGLSVASRKHTIVFVGFSSEEVGLKGSDFYVKQLSREQLARIHAMINIDSIGVGPTKIWMTHSDHRLAQLFFGIANSMHSPVGVMNADSVGDEDGSSFRAYHVPTLMLHSITSENFPVLHSSRDKISAMHMNEYYETYRLTLVYLAYLDASLD
jgi:hypothetical protein